MTSHLSLDEAFHFDPYNPLVRKWYELTDLQPEDAIFEAEDAKLLRQRVEDLETAESAYKAALRSIRLQAFPDMYRRADSFSEEYEYVTNSIDLNIYREEYCPDIDAEAAFALIGDGELLEIWVCENQFLSNPQFERVF